MIQALNDNGGGLPFWINFELSPGAVIYAFGLAVLAALIMGVLPGLKATGVGVNANLHELHGRSGTRLGATWTTLIVAQVAVAVAVLPAAVFIASRVMRMERPVRVLPPSPSSSARGTGPDAPRVRSNDRVRAQQAGTHLADCEREPGVIGVTFSSGIPGLPAPERSASRRACGCANVSDHVPDVGITDALSAEHDQSERRSVRHLRRARFLPVATSTAGDVGTANTVIVNRSFVEMYLQEPNALGLSFPLCRDERPGAGAAGIKSSASCAISRRSRSNFQRRRADHLPSRRASGTCIP